MSDFLQQVKDWIKGASLSDLGFAFLGINVLLCLVILLWRATIFAVFQV